MDEGRVLRPSPHVPSFLQGADGGMVDAHALGACGETRGGSSPLPPTISLDSYLVKREACHGKEPFMF
jgi:hypothetical protein